MLSLHKKNKLFSKRNWPGLKVRYNMLLYTSSMITIFYNNITENCMNGKVHQSCGTACPKTCDNLNPSFCTKQCVSGCFCPFGLVQLGNSCVTPSQCPSKLRQASYFSNMNNVKSLANGTFHINFDPLASKILIFFFADIQKMVFLKTLIEKLNKN